MKTRPLAYIGITALITYAVVFYLGVISVAFVVPALAILLLLSLTVKRLRKMFATVLAVLLVFSACSVHSYLFSQSTFSETDRLNGKTAGISAEVISEPRTNGSRFYYELESFTIDGKAVKTKLKLGSRTSLNVEFGDMIFCKGKLSRLDENYYISKGFRLNVDTGDEKPVIKKTDEKGIGYIPVFVRQKLIHSLSVLLDGDEADLCRAITLGDKYALSNELRADFRNSGTSYIIVVSGMHMSIVASMIFLALSPLKKRRRTRILQCAAAVLMILFYVALSGFQISAIRAAIMIIIALIAPNLGVRYDIFSGIGAAAILLTLFNPLSVADVGMLLSFGAVMGIALFLPKLSLRVEEKLSSRSRDIFRKQMFEGGDFRKCLKYQLRLYAIGWLRTVTELFFVTISATMGVAPLTILFFGSFNPVSVLFGVVLGIIVSVLMFCALLASVLWYVPVISFISLPMALCARASARLMIAIVRGMNELPFSHVYVASDAARACLIACFIVLGAMILFGKRRKLLLAAASTSVVFAVIFNSVYFMSKDVALTVFRADGITVSLSGKTSTSVLSCGGSWKYRTEILDKTGDGRDRLKLVLVPDSKKQSSYYADSFLSEFDVENVMLYYNKYTKYSVRKRAAEKSNLTTFENGEICELSLDDGVSDTVISTKDRTWQFIRSANTTVLIAPEKADAGELPAQYRAADYIVLGGEIKQHDLLKAPKVIWARDEKPPTEYRNTDNIKDDYKIMMK